MINSINQYQEELHLQSAHGLIFCKSHESLLDKKLISQIALNILFGGMLSFTTISFTALPIALSITTLSLLAYNISILRHRYLMQQEALILKPLFESVLNGKYAKSLMQFDNFESRAKKLKGNVNIYYSLFPVQEIRGRDHGFFARLGWQIHLMNCYFNNYKQDGLQSFVFRSSDKVNKIVPELLQDKKIETKATNNYSELLLAAFINQLQNINENSLRSSWEKGSETEYLNRLLNHGDNLSIESQKIITDFLKCKDIQEIHKKASNLKSSMATPLEIFF